MTRKNLPREVVELDLARSTARAARDRADHNFREADRAFQTAVCEYQAANIEAARNVCRKYGVSPADIPGLEWADPDAVYRLDYGCSLRADGYGRSDVFVPAVSVRATAQRTRELIRAHLEVVGKLRRTDHAIAAEVARLEKKIADLRHNPAQEQLDRIGRKRVEAVSRASRRGKSDGHQLILDEAYVARAASVADATVDQSPQFFDQSKPC